MDQLANEIYQKEVKQRTCTLCGAKGHIARGHAAWEERQKKQAEREANPLQPDTKTHRGRGPRYRPHGDVVKNSGIHTPVHLKEIQGKDRRRVCIVCEKRVTHACKQCNVGCCFGDALGVARVCCWEVWHETCPVELIEELSARISRTPSQVSTKRLRT